MSDSTTSIPADGALLVAFIAEHSDWSLERFAGEFPDPFLVELRQRIDASGTGFETPPAHTEDAMTAAAMNATDPTPQSRLLTVAKRSAMFPSKVTVGRTKNNDVVIPAAGMSKLHAFFNVHEGAYTLLDASSRNGSFVNSKRLDSSNGLLLKNGDRVQFSGQCFRFLLPAGFHAEMKTLLPDD